MARKTEDALVITAVALLLVAIGVSWLLLSADPLKREAFWNGGAPSPSHPGARRSFQGDRRFPQAATTY